MPLYSYKCDVCGHTTEQLRPMKDAKRVDPCPVCAKENKSTTRYGLLQPIIAPYARTPSRWGDTNACRIRKQ
jgi:putative FmdB family regulatory protein